VSALQAFYGPLPKLPRDPFTLFVLEVLSAHSTPHKRDAALAALKRIPALTPDSMWRAPQKKLEESVKLAGPYTDKRLQALRTASTSSGARKAGVDHPRTAAGRAAVRSSRCRSWASRGRTGCCCSRRSRVSCGRCPRHPGRAAPRLRRGDQSSASRRDRSRTRSPRELPALGRGLSTRVPLSLAPPAAPLAQRRIPHCIVCPLLTECPEGQRRMARRERAGAGGLGGSTRAPLQGRQSISLAKPPVCGAS
jgi:hypothetical protein